ncbi:unnamed protein product [Adineta steineri]|uniref:G-protein coupled receptors family 1 profile domain-containing protein n=2 Tax=Adineta steineri TaxID=433720 RepID=A0A819F5K7_9BILA|nr:unnamed protein product [Adineta steineri]CAF3860074.1 unnamed protein product [Adineta steineri]
MNNTVLNYQLDQISTYSLPIIMAFTFISNIINIGVLCRRKLRLSPCTHYFLALSIATLIYSSVSPMNLFFSYCYGISLDASPFGCKFLSFSIYLSALFVSLMLVCASIDRFIASSSSVHLRYLSKIQITRQLIVIISIAIIIYMSPFFIIYHWNHSNNECIQTSTAITIIYFSSRILLYYIIAPLLMIVFGLLTIYNIRNQTQRVSPVNLFNSNRRTEGQLARMLIIQVSVYVFFSIPAAVTYILTTFIPSMNTILITDIRIYTIIWQQGTYILSPFLYILSANIYKQELKKMFNMQYYHKQILDYITYLFQSN